MEIFEGLGVSLMGLGNTVMLIFKVSTIPQLLDVKALLRPTFLRSPCLTEAGRILFNTVHFCYRCA
jgi:hypothetical protein